MSRLHRPHNENSLAYFLCVQAVWLYIHPCLKGDLQETSEHAFTLLVLQDLRIHLQVLHVQYNKLKCTLHPY